MAQEKMNPTVRENRIGAITAVLGVMPDSGISKAEIYLLTLLRDELMEEQRAVAVADCRWLRTLGIEPEPDGAVDARETSAAEMKAGMLNLRVLLGQAFNSRVVALHFLPGFKTPKPLNALPLND
ncbi:MAG: hypothetical protein P4L40_09815 [Terracidiphilus sp.]|nr:hypothetical protein [Terracidiphilus sp.]